MNQPFTVPADGNILLGVIPENVQAIAEQSISTTRETYGRMSATTKAIGEKVLENTTKNADAFFAAALAMARAKTVQEIATLQSDYLQRQFAVVSHQAQELFDLSARFGKQAVESGAANGASAHGRDAP